MIKIFIGGGIKTDEKLGVFNDKSIILLLGGIIDVRSKVRITSVV